MEHGRIRTCIETEFAVRGRRAQGQIKNVSEGGLFISTASVPEEGESVDLTFRASGGGEVSLSGLVWWTTNGRNGKRHRTSGFGLRLLDESDDFCSLLASL
jgi:Tfp pilus assembly protein PilZ